MFLYAVEEMSFTRAAARACVTQQCLSDHIRRLEELYRVRLFDRSPHLKLTSAGQLLYRALKDIERIEADVLQQLLGVDESARGVIKLGIGNNRANLVVPSLFSTYQKQFPNIRLSVVLDINQRLIPQLLNGTIDLFLGVDCPAESLLNKEHITDEPIYLLATEDLLAQSLPHWQSERTTIRPQEISHLPVAMNPATSTVFQEIEHFFKKHNTALNITCTIEDYDTQMVLCRSHQAAMFGPEGFLSNLPPVTPRAEQVRILGIEGLTSTVAIDIVTHKTHYYAPYIGAFCSILKEQYLARKDRTHEYLSRLNDPRGG